MVIERMALRKGQMDEFGQIGTGKVRACKIDAAVLVAGEAGVLIVLVFCERLVLTWGLVAASKVFLMTGFVLSRLFTCLFYIFPGAPSAVLQSSSVLQSTVPRPYRLSVRAENGDAGQRYHAPCV